ncbi:histidine kinase [Candidatus Magnetomorum sp. HK-1]|nr:histidine kinase [Candidatus Magnetomorum sp. HK-1]
MQNEHILVAEDDLGLQTSLSFILEDEGFALTLVPNGKVAFEKIQDAYQKGHMFDLLITDIQMPELNGLQLIKSISQAGIDLPIIVTTGYGDKQTLIELIRLGCDDFLSKPFEPDDVCQKVHEILSKVRTHKAMEEQKYSELIKENIDLSREIDSYKRSFSSLRKELDSAIITYNDLICLREDAYKVPIAYRIQSLKDLGGDYVDIRNTKEGCDFIIADVAGHDMAASYHTVMIKSFFDENCRTQKDGNTFFQLLNLALMENGKNERMVTGIFLRLDLQKKHAEAISAAHPKLFLFDSQKQELRQIDIEGSVLGMFEDATFETSKFSISSGDRLIFYSDGIPNAFHIDGPTGKKHTLKESGLCQLLDESMHLTLSGMVSNVWKKIEAFTRCKQTDDMLLFALEIP